MQYGPRQRTNRGHEYHEKEYEGLQFTTKLAPIAPLRGLQRSHIDIRCIARGPGRVQAPDVRRPEGPFRLGDQIDSPSMKNLRVSSLR